MRDTTPPMISLSVSPATLWPPDHKLDEVEVGVTRSDVCDVDPTFSLVGVTSSEAPNGAGDGNTSADVVAAMGTAATRVQLRAERRGDGPGRAYALTYEAVDASNNRARSSAVVRVPHDQGK